MFSGVFKTHRLAKTVMRMCTFSSRAGPYSALAYTPENRLQDVSVAHIMELNEYKIVYNILITLMCVLPPSYISSMHTGTYTDQTTLAYENPIKIHN